MSDEKNADDAAYARKMADERNEWEARYRELAVEVLGYAVDQGIPSTDARVAVDCIRQIRASLNKGLDPRDVVIEEARSWLFECDAVDCERKALASSESGTWWCEGHRPPDAKDLLRARLVRALDALPVSSAPCAPVVMPEDAKPRNPSPDEARSERFARAKAEWERIMGEPCYAVEPPSDQHWCKTHNEYDCEICTSEAQSNVCNWCKACKHDDCVGYGCGCDCVVARGLEPHREKTRSGEAITERCDEPECFREAVPNGQWCNEHGAWNGPRRERDQANDESGTASANRGGREGSLRGDGQQNDGAALSPDREARDGAGEGVPREVTDLPNASERCEVCNVELGPNGQRFCDSACRLVFDEDDVNTQLVPTEAAHSSGETDDESSSPRDPAADRFVAMHSVMAHASQDARWRGYQALVALLADVRRETVDACARAVEACPNGLSERIEEAADRVRALQFTSKDSEKKT